MNAAPITPARLTAASATTDPRARPSSDRELWDAAEQLEALFVTELVKATRLGSAGLSSKQAGGSLYQGMTEEIFGRALAERSDFGVAREVFRSLGGKTIPAPQITAAAPQIHRSFAPSSSAAGAAGKSGAPRDRRLGRYARIIEEAAARFGVDANVIGAVIVRESGGDATAVSRRGAEGLMQIMPSTGRDLGLADSFDPRQNILAGSRYLAELLDRFAGDLPLALAAYNAGPTVVARHGGVPPYRETMSYVADVLSLVDRFRGGSGR